MSAWNSLRTKVMIHYEGLKEYHTPEEWEEYYGSHKWLACTEKEICEELHFIAFSTDNAGLILQFVHSIKDHKDFKEVFDMLMNTTTHST